MNRTPVAWNKVAERAIKKDFYKKGVRKGLAPKTFPERLPGKWPRVARDPALLRILLPALLIKVTPKYCTGVDLNRNFPYEWAVSYMDLD